jgi:hypothetical protein
MVANYGSVSVVAVLLGGGPPGSVSVTDVTLYGFGRFGVPFI